jgi:hypothetical protein
MRLVQNGLLRNGRDLAKVDLQLDPAGHPATVEVDEKLLAFEELIISKTKKVAANER